MRDSTRALFPRKTFATELDSADLDHDDGAADAAASRTNDRRHKRLPQTKRHATRAARPGMLLAERTRELLIAQGTLRIEAEARVRLEVLLGQAGKVPSVAYHASGLAHDLNNLLGVIMCSLEAMERRIDAGGVDGMARYLSNAVTATERAASLSRRLLDFARPRPPGARPTDPQSQIRGLDDLLRSVAGTKIDFVLETDGASWPIMCDPDEFDNVLLNLVINARDAMPLGGKLILRIANLRLDEAAVRAIGGGAGAGDFVAISVTDTGVGIAPEVISQIFEPFFTTKGGQGTGLGLAMVDSFARQTSGRVQIDSEPGQGSTFRLYLPRCNACGACTCGNGALPPAAVPRPGFGLAAASPAVAISE
nr:ATP-binding protein [uncultured Rhodopila sp.]